MSKYISNQSCQMCRQIEKGLTKMQIGNTTHHICYDCMANLTLDMIEFAVHNLSKEIASKGYEIELSNDGIYSFKPISDNS